MKFLTYPGRLGDTNLALSIALQKLNKWNAKNIVSPFLTDGQFEIAMANQRMIVSASSDSQHIIDLWHCATGQMHALIDKTVEVLERGDGSRWHFANLAKSRYDTVDKLEKSAQMIAMNMLSRNGGSMRANRKNQFFSDYAIQGTMLFKVDNKGQRFFLLDLQDLNNLDLNGISVQISNPFEAIENVKDEYLFVYPPSMLFPRPVQGESPEQMENFSHNKLHNMLKNKNKWILLAEDDGNIETEFKNCEIERIRSKRVTDVYDLLIVARR